MKVAKVKVSGSGREGDPFRVHLPTYRMIPGSEVYDEVDKAKLVTVDVEVPDDEVDEKGALSKEKIRKKYAGQKAWDRDDLLSDV